MSSQEVPTTINTLFSKTVIYEIPRYQRHYVWDERNWEALWTDIQKAANLRCGGKKTVKKHYTGAIVVRPTGNDIEIIDGQQRLTTFQIIFCAIRDVYGALKGRKAFEDRYEIVMNIETLIWNTLGIGTSFSPNSVKYKLLPREGSDRDTFQALVDNQRIEEHSGSIRDAYIYFKQTINDYVTTPEVPDKQKYERLNNLYESVLKDFTFTEIAIQPDDEPAKIFQTINGTGRALDEFDLLRSNLFLRARTRPKRDEFYTAHWNQFEEDVDFWQEEKRVDAFLADFLRIKRGEAFNPEISLFDQYQDYYKCLAATFNLDEDDLQLIEYEFRQLKRYADFYQELHDPKSGETEIKSRIQFYSLPQPSITTDIADLATLFILCLQNEFTLPTDILSRVLTLCESYIMRSMLESDTGSTAPLEKLMDVFRHTIDREQDFSLVNFVYQLSNTETGNPDDKDMPDDQRVKICLSNLPQSAKKRRTSRSHFMRAYGSHLFKQLDWNISMDELLVRFCEIWTSAEVILQDGFKDGLPIVYNRLPLSLEEAKARLKNYKFMTYTGIVELSKYEIYIDDSTGHVDVMGDDTNGEPLMAVPLFAFPAGTKPEPYQICNNVRPESEIEGFAVKDWLQLYADNKESLGGKHMLLRRQTKKTAAIQGKVVTRGGYVLEGKLKGFDAAAIYMQINKQTVTIYMDSLYELNTAEMLNSTPRNFWTVDDELISLSKYEIYQNKLIGTYPDENSNRKIVTDMNKILFDYPAGSKFNVYKITSLENNQGQLDFQELLAARRGGVKVRVILNNKWMLQGKIKKVVDRSLFQMEVENDVNVNVYNHGITESLEVDEYDYNIEDLLVKFN